MFKNGKIKAIIFGLVAGIIIVGITIGVISNSNRSEMPDEYLNGIRYLRNSMKDPTSFVIYGDVFVLDRENEDMTSAGFGSINIGIKYNANNSYGALGGIDEGIIYSTTSGGWEYYSVFSDNVNDRFLAGIQGKNYIENSYISIREDLEETKAQIKEIKSGKSSLSKEEQEEVMESYESLKEEKEEYIRYDGKKVAKAIGCEYYEY